MNAPTRFRALLLGVAFPLAALATSGCGSGYDGDVFYCSHPCTLSLITAGSLDDALAQCRGEPVRRSVHRHAGHGSEPLFVQLRMERALLTVGRCAAWTSARR